MNVVTQHKRLSWTSAVALLVLLVWLCWPDRRMAQVQALQKELFSDAGKKLSAEERKGKFQELRKATERLSSSQKQELAKAGQQRKQQDLERYARLSKKEQNEYLDQQIERTKNFTKQGNNNPANGKGSGSFGGNQQSMSSADRDRFRKQRLDESTPEFRALFNQYRKDLQTRMTGRK